MPGETSFVDKVSMLRLLLDRKGDAFVPPLKTICLYDAFLLRFFSLYFRWCGAAMP